MERSDDSEAIGHLLASLVRLRIKRNIPVVDCKEGGVFAAVERRGVAGTGLDFEVEHWERGWYEQFLE